MGPQQNKAIYSYYTTGFFKCSILSCQKKIAATKVSHKVQDPSKIRFFIVEGTYNPTLELRMMVTPNASISWRTLNINPPPNTIVMRFHLIPHTTLSAAIPTFDRTALSFKPMYSGVKFSHHENIPSEGLGFSLEVTDLKWEMAPGSVPEVTISWQSENNIKLNSDLGDNVEVGHPCYNTVKDFMDFRHTSGPVGFEFDTYSVLLPCNAVQQTAFWRFATVKNTNMATISAYLPQRLNSEGVWTMEALRPVHFVKPTGRKDNPLEENVSICAARYVIFMASIPLDGDDDDEDIILPVQGDAVNIIWVHQASDSESPVIWSGKVIMSPYEHDAKWNVAMIVHMNKIHEDYNFLNGNAALLKFIDRILFGEHTLNITHANWIRTFMTGQRNT
ncbi:hypothetical protein SBOR_4048 [Sclerotinia borealis F-4128]|uniref:Uncharacterized protein n=1 Tax=Sclerotinia borealis (strain F-4128) TaxID=1432307 RepID=W9CHW1_SCLBF|nr:hypothetical protein SBOR_4048 [Sclerotinia borealis F-4128]